MHGAGLKYNLLFCALEAAYWAAYSALYAFMIPILASHGYSSALSGIVMTLLAMGSIIVQPLLGYIMDTFVSSKRLLIGAMAVAILLTAFLPKVVTLSPAIAIPYIVLLSVADYSIYSAIDIWAILSIPKYRGMDFAFVRAGGSLGYALAALIMGAVIVKTGTKILFYVHGGLLLLAIGICFLIEEVPCGNRRSPAHVAGDDVDSQERLGLWDIIKMLAKNQRYVIFIFSMMLMQFAFRLTGTYLPLLVSNAGGNSAHFGVAVFIGSGLEAVAMMVMSRLLAAGISIPHVVGFSFICGIVRMLTLHLDGSVYLFIFLQIFQALAVGAYIRAFVQYISQITPLKIASSATTIGSALSSGIGSMLGNFSGGLVIEHWGLHTQMNISALALVAGALVFLPIFIEEEKKRRIAAKRPMLHS